MFARSVSATSESWLTRVHAFLELRRLSRSLLNRPVRPHGLPYTRALYQKKGDALKGEHDARFNQRHSAMTIIATIINFSRLVRLGETPSLRRIRLGCLG